MLKNMTASPLKVSHNGVTYTFYPLSDGDYGEFEMWMQDRFVSAARRHINDLPKDERTLILMDVIRQASLLTFSSPEAKALMGTVEGSSFLLYLSLRRGDGSLTHADVRALCTNPDFIVKGVQAVAQITAVPFPAAPKKVRGKQRSAKPSTEKKSTKS